MSNLGELGKKYEKLFGMEDLGRLGRDALDRFNETGEMKLPPKAKGEDFLGMLDGIRKRMGANPEAAPFVPPPPPPPPLPPGPPPPERVRTSEPPRTAAGRAKGQTVYDNSSRRKTKDEPTMADILRKNYEYMRGEQNEKTQDLIRGVIHALETVLLERGRDDLVLSARRRAR